MHALGCSADEGLDRMRQVSQRNNMRTTEVAATIIGARAGRPGPAGPAPQGGQAPRDGRAAGPGQARGSGQGRRVRAGAPAGAGAPVGAGTPVPGGPARDTRRQALTWLVTCADWVPTVPDVPDRQPPGGAAEAAGPP